MKTFAIVLVCYDRLDSLQRLIKSLENVDYENRKDITLIFSIDKSKNDDVYNFAKSYNWNFGNKKIRAFSENQGLKSHILQCGDYTKEYDIVTILEDDLYVSNSMYKYAYYSSIFYEQDDRIAGISLYGFQKNWLNWDYRFEPLQADDDIYFIKIAHSWGQVWCERKWKPFIEWYENNTSFEKDQSLPENLYTWGENSWLKYHIKYCIDNNKYFVFPHLSLSTNFSEVGEHSKYTLTDYQTELAWNKDKYKFSAFDDTSISYDEFFNSELIYKKLNIDKKDLCLDLWNTNNKFNIKNKRFLLTTKMLNFKIITSYELSLRPIELNVLNDNHGNGIYLYDTHNEMHQTKFPFNKIILEKYIYRVSNGKRLLQFSLISTLERIFLIIERVPEILKNKIWKGSKNE